MPKVKTQEQFCENLNKVNKNIEVISTYLGCKDKITVKCKLDDYIWESTPERLLSGSGCKQCCIKKQRKTHEQFCIDLNIVNPNIEVVGEYLGSKKGIKVRCKLDGYEWDSRPEFLLKGHGCHKCQVKNATKSTQQFINELKSIREDVVFVGEYIKSKTKVQFKCLKCNNYFYMEPYRVLNNTNCPVCCKSPTQIVVGFNDMWTTAPEVAQWLADPEDGYKYTKGANSKVNWKCPNCGQIIRGRYINNVHKRGKVSCPYCCDGASIPSKFVGSVLYQFCDDVYSEKVFTWSENKRYDFFIPSLNMVCEVHGAQHYYSDFSNVGGKTFREEQYNDKIKLDNALNNGIDYYIVVDGSDSNFDFLQKSIMNSDLSKHFDLSKVNWTICQENSISSMVVKACDLFSQGKTTYEIAKIINIAVGTICQYLHKGNDLGLCNYTGFDSKKKSVRCIQTNEIFESITAASRKYETSNVSHITQCCKGNRNYSGRHPKTNQLLQWEYYPAAI